VYREHAPTVMRWASRLLGRTQDAADVTQEVFLVVHRRLPEFAERGGTLETWLFRITRNVVRSRRRADRVRGWFAQAPEVEPEVADRGPGPAELLESKSDRALVGRVLASLKETDRELLVLFELEGYPGERVAELLELSPKVIWVRLHRARARFLAALQQLAPEVAP
jgi:RNA polymerase sigma-70 factor (ECF subfamily)